jgi:2-methylcitrate dehydratase PrpD
LAVAAAGGVRRAFGAMVKSLQVGFAADAGVRAARLAAAGASADPAALDQWLELVGGDRGRLDMTGPAVPGGLAIKVFPCCNALQRPISAVNEGLRGAVDIRDISAIVVRTPQGAAQPLIHHRPVTGLQGKYSPEYAIATALLDPHSGFDSFSDAAVIRPDAQRLIRLVETTLTPGGHWLLAGDVEITLLLTDGSRRSATLQLPPGSPGRPPSATEMDAELAACGPDVPALLAGIDWDGDSAMLAEQFPGAQAGQLSCHGGA